MRPSTILRSYSGEIRFPGHGGTLMLVYFYFGTDFVDYAVFVFVVAIEIQVPESLLRTILRRVMKPFSCPIFTLEISDFGKLFDVV